MPANTWAQRSTRLDHSLGSKAGISPPLPDSAAVSWLEAMPATARLQYSVRATVLPLQRPKYLLQQICCTRNRILTNALLLLGDFLEQAIQSFFCYIAVKIQRLRISHCAQDFSDVFILVRRTQYLFVICSDPGCLRPLFDDGQESLIQIGFGRAAKELGGCIGRSGEDRFGIRDSHVRNRFSEYRSAFRHCFLSRMIHGCYELIRQLIFFQGA